MLQLKNIWSDQQFERVFRGLISCFQPRFKILAYHSVHSVSRDPYEIKTNQFISQVQYLATMGYNVVGLEDAVDMMLKEHIKDKTVVITFDDGFASLTESAFPVLKDFGFSATVFIPFNFIGGIDSFSYEHPRPEMSILSWDSIEKSKDYGISYGSHTMSHVDLTNLSHTAVVQEVAESRQMLKKIGSIFFALAYPFGLFNKNIKQIIRDNRYDCALCFGNILSNTVSTNFFELKREKILNSTSIDQFKKAVDTKYDFKRKLQGLLNLL